MFGGGDTWLENLWHSIISIPNLLLAWREFKVGKRKKSGVAEFELFLEDTIFELHQHLIYKTYTHDIYQDFYISDPKRRHIHKASVRDRVVHQAIYRILYPMFDTHFIYDSFSSRKLKGTHYGVERAYCACRKASKNWKKKIYVLKCDVKKFFDSVDHSILRRLIEKKVGCIDTMYLIDLLFKSFEKEDGKGLPLGNVTSQLFANVYLNKLDQFVKHNLKIKYYFRYCDDFITIHEDEKFLYNLIPKISGFLSRVLKLELHPKKVEVRSVTRGLDFLGYVILPHVIILRTRTKHRIIKKINIIRKQMIQGEISKEDFSSVLASYVGIISHCRDKKLQNYIKKFL